MSNNSITFNLQKCFIRIKEARQNSFESGRNISNIDIISQIIREEFGELEKDLALQDQIVNELLENIDVWMVAEFEKEETYLIDSEQNFEVFCPICQKNTLHSSRKSGHLYICSCGQKINFNGDLKDLSFKIKKSVSDHESKSCSEILSFFVEPKDNSNILSFFCTNCNFYGSI